MKNYNRVTLKPRYTEVTKLHFVARRLNVPLDKHVCSFFSVILLSNLYLDHVRLHDADPLCFPAKRGKLQVICRLTFAWKNKYIIQCSNSFRQIPDRSFYIHFQDYEKDCLWHLDANDWTQISNNDCLYSQMFFSEDFVSWLTVLDLIDFISPEFCQPYVMHRPTAHHSRSSCPRILACRFASL